MEDRICKICGRSQNDMLNMIVHYEVAHGTDSLWDLLTDKL